MSDTTKEIDLILADRCWFAEQEIKAGENIRDVLLNLQDELSDRFESYINNKVKEARIDTINEVIEAISPNQQGQWEDDGGNVAWYLDELIDRIKELEK